MRENKQQRIDRLLLIVPKTLPEGVDLLVDYVFSNHEYIFYNKKKKYSYCSVCRKEICKDFNVHIAARHNVKDECPVCGSTVTYKCIGLLHDKKAKWWKPFQPAGITTNFNILIIQKCDDEWFVFRRFSVIKMNVVGITCTTEMEWVENQRVFFNGINSINVVGRLFENNGVIHTRWMPSEKARFDQPDDWNAYVTPKGDIEYLENLHEITRNSYLKYALPCMNQMKLKMGQLIYLSKYKRPIEYLCKAGLTNAAEDLLSERYKITGKEKTLPELLKVPDNTMPLIKSNNMHIWDIKDIQTLANNGFTKIDEVILNKYQSCKYTYDAAKKIVNDLDLGIFMKYFEKQYPNEWMKYGYRVVNDYTDYLKACADLEYDLTRKDVLFPANLTEAHDRETKRAIECKDEIETRAVQKIDKRYAKENEKYAFEKDGLLIRMIRNYKELVKEGSALCHCVGGYAADVRSGATTILVIRRVNNPEKPYYTLEYKGNKITQYHGYKNEREQYGKRDPEVEAFVRVWIKELSRRKNKKSIAKEKRSSMAIAV